MPSSTCKGSAAIPDLVRAAKAAGVPFVASPPGTSLRLEGASGRVYVLRDAWGTGCKVLKLRGAEYVQVRHFPRPAEAVAEAARLAGLSPRREGVA